MRFLASASLLALLLLPAVQAEEVPIPGTGPVGTPAFIDLPRTCDPVGLVCVGPVHAPAPVGIAVDGDGFVLVVDLDGRPGSTVPPTYHNVTVGSITVPVVLCPNGCNVPATPTVDLEGETTVETYGPGACTVTLDASPGQSCDPLLECDPLDGCGVPDVEDFCLRDDRGVPWCFLPVVGPCDPMDYDGCPMILVGVVLDTLQFVLDTASPVIVIVLDLAGDVIGLVPGPDDLCLEGGEFPECVPTPECAGDPLSCIPPAPTLEELARTVIPACSPEVMAQPAYVCFTSDEDGGAVTKYLGVNELKIGKNPPPGVPPLPVCLSCPIFL